LFGQHRTSASIPVNPGARGRGYYRRSQGRIPPARRIEAKYQSCMEMRESSQTPAASLVQENPRHIVKLRYFVDPVGSAVAAVDAEPPHAGSEGVRMKAEDDGGAVGPFDPTVGVGEHAQDVLALEV